MEVQSGTWMHSSDAWSHAPIIHHWIGPKRCQPLGTNGAMYWMVPIILWRSNADTVAAKPQWSRMAQALVLIFGRGATIKSCIRKCIAMNWKSLVDFNSDFSKLINHPRWHNNRMTSCAWELESTRMSQSSRYTCTRTPCSHSSCTIGLRSLVNSLGDVVSLNGGQVNWEVRWLVQKRRNFCIARLIGTWRYMSRMSVDTAHSSAWMDALTDCAVYPWKWGTTRYLLRGDRSMTGRNSPGFLGNKKESAEKAQGSMAPFFSRLKTVWVSLSEG